LATIRQWRTLEKKGLMAILNKIDGLWDALKTEAEVEAELVKQVKKTGELLALDEQYIFPTSAQKGLLGKINGDADLLDQSRLLTLEKALSEELIPAKNYHS
jgi:hypothetical protein